MRRRKHWDTSKGERGLAFQRGYMDRAAGANRNLPPYELEQLELRQAWRAGFDRGKTGLVVKLPQVPNG